MDSIIYEICEMIISKNDTKKSIEFNEKFDAAQLKYDKLMDMLNEEQTAAFHEYETAERNLSKITGRDNFKLGVKAGIRLALEVFSND